VTIKEWGKISIAGTTVVVIKGNL